MARPSLSIHGPGKRIKLITNSAAAMRCCSMLSKSFNFVFLQLWKGELLQNTKVNFLSDHGLGEKNAVIVSWNKTHFKLLLSTERHYFVTYTFWVRYYLNFRVRQYAGCLSHGRNFCTPVYPGPPGAGPGPDEIVLTGPPARAERQKIFTRNRRTCGQLHGGLGLVWNG